MLGLPPPRSQASPRAWTVPRAFFQGDAFGNFCPQATRRFQTPSWLTGLFKARASEVSQFLWSFRGLCRFRVRGDTLFTNFGSQVASLTSATCSMLLAFHASQLIWSTVVTSAACGRTLPTPPCKAEKLRFRRRAAARYPCLCAELQTRYDRPRVHGASWRQAASDPRLGRPPALVSFMFSRAALLNPYTRISANTRRQVSQPPFLLGGVWGGRNSKPLSRIVGRGAGR